MRTSTIAEKPRKQAISGRFWAGRTYRGRIKDDHKRYSERFFDSRPVEQEKIDQILEAGRFAPTAVNNQPQRIYVFQTEEALKAVRKIRVSTFNAPLIILVCYDITIAAHHPYDNWYKDYNTGEQDAAIVATTMMYEAEELGVHSVWMRGFTSQDVAETLDLPQNIIPVMMFAMGVSLGKVKAASVPLPKKTDSGDCYDPVRKGCYYMKLVNELFQKFTLIESNLIPYGFRKEGNAYYFHCLIHQDEFDLQITVKDQKLDARLMELEFDDEYTAINRESSGSFVGELRAECEEILLDIREKCFKEEYFIFSQTNRIAGLIKEKYGVEPEKNKDGFGTNGVFRNPVTRKWIGLVM